MKKRLDHRWGQAAAWLLAILLLYPLSLGPAIVVFEAMGRPPRLEALLVLLYLPLANLPEPLASLLHRYVDLWCP